MNDNILNIMPEMITGIKLDNRLCILPAYNESIRQKSIPERLIALQDIYRIFIPNQMSREIYALFIPQRITTFNSFAVRTSIPWLF